MKDQQKRSKSSRALSMVNPDAAGIDLGGHFKTGHQWTGQNRPPEVASETV